MIASKILGLCVILVVASAAQAAFWTQGSPPRIYWALNCDWPAQDLNKIRAGGDRCGQLCRNEAACSHFAWNNADGGTCYMKGGSVSQNGAIFKGQTTCGIDCNSGLSNCSGI